METQSVPSEASYIEEELFQLDRILREPSRGFLMMPSESEDEVWPRIYVGDEFIAKDIARLKHLGITHILNVAYGIGTRHAVDTDEIYYKDSGIVFKGANAHEHTSFELLPFWDDTSDFIHTALEEKGNKILVHCRDGFSRSAATTIAYLMMYHNMTTQEATRTVRAKREIGPKMEFRKQLCHLNAILLEKRGSLK
ncbi:dual specificity protein phosphatase 3-like [Glandiceps talaboti]